MGRPGKDASRMRKRRRTETGNEKGKRLKEARERNAQRISNENPDQRENRLSKQRTYMLRRLNKESQEDYDHRVSLIHTRLANESQEDYDHRMSLIRNRLTNESQEEYDRRISLIHTRLANESQEDYDHRVSLIRNRLTNESQEDYDRRLSKIHTRLANESQEDHDHRISLIRNRLTNESQVDYDRRLSKIHTRLANESQEDHDHRMSLIRNRITNESQEDYNRRLSLIHARLANETEEERSQRLSGLRIRSGRRLLNETPEARVERLNVVRETARNRRNMLSTEQFREAINIFADVPCAICNKALFPQQRVNLQTTIYSSILPPELVGNIIITCTRCSNNIKKRKTPPQAYWNKLSVNAIPPELADLTEMERRFLCRVVPFLKIIKLQNRFSQYWCKGQAILFAQDVVELAEQLPLRPNQTGLILVVESLENVQRSREFIIDSDRLNRALNWLMANNILYRDVCPHFNRNIDITEIVQVVDEPTTNRNSGTVTSINHFTSLNENVAILRGSFHQGDERFSCESRGRQCTAIATISCIAFYSHDPNLLCKSDIDYIVIKGDGYYHDCIYTRPHLSTGEVNPEYLAATELLSRVVYNRQTFNISGYEQPIYNGHVTNDDSENGFPNLKNALIFFFREHSFGLLTTNSSTVAVHSRSQSASDSFWLFDSHARGAKGVKAPLRGTSCCMRFNNIDKLHAMLCRNLVVKDSVNRDYTLNVYSLTSLQITPEMPLPGTFLQDNNIPSATNGQADPEHTPTVNEHRALVETRTIETTSMLRNIDEVVPNLDSVINLSNSELEPQLRLAEITRKTAPPLNLERDRRIEELAWYFLFPDGKNGYQEQREVYITPLDYFQSRVMGTDKRFHRNDYLFYALSVVEYFRAKSSVSVSCRMRQGQGEHTPRGLVDNMHLTMRNIRGSASYWQRCCSELIAMVRTLGPPTWFLTFSCNDLHWPDMIKALLLADNQDSCEESQLTFQQRLDLVQKYPVVVARQFSVRVNALMRYLKSNNDCLAGPVVDYWYRIEFQNRGSPHLHLLVWCSNVPDFATPEGINVIERVVSCSANPENPELKSLVNNVQIHKHTSTCYKNRDNQTCRFGFPRAPNDSTTCLGPDEAVANNGRFCILKRTSDETMINNYNSELLFLWEGNIDVQPCGNVTAVSYYVAKYVSKCEPHDTGEVIRATITKAKRQGGTLWNQLFSVAMAILSQRLVSAPECAYRLCHLPLKMSSRKTVFINSCRPNERFRLLRFEGNETSIYNNIFDRYVQRPNELENLSLAEFAVRFETVSNTTWSEEDGDSELRQLDSEPSRYIKLRDNTRMRIRNKAAVLRTRYYTLNSDKEGYYYNLIVCHVPFRDEAELLLDQETAEACFLRRQNELRPLQSNISAEQFAHAEQIIQQALAQATALNAARNIHMQDNAPIICADEQIIEDLDNFCEDVPDDRAALPDDVFLANIRGLNIQQSELFEKVSRAIESDLSGAENQLLLFITGGAGSGKSYLLKLLVQHIKRCYAPTVDILLKPSFVEVASLTGVAARQIFGKTLHSLFSLPIEKKGNTMTYRRLTGQKLEQERRKWRNINWLVIDEISMVSYENLRIIHLRLQEFKNNDKLFGGVNIILFGDIMQLPPVKGHWCFLQPLWLAAEVDLWKKMSFCELTINMRQQNDSNFIDLLNNLRVGELTTAQLELLCERRRVPLTGEFADGMAVRIYPTVRQVDAYNTLMIADNAKTQRIYSINAVDESREIATYGNLPPSNVIPKDVNNCGGLLSTVQLGIGSRIMLRRNISVSEGLVNGVMGIVHKLKWPALRREQIEDGELPEAVIIKFDDDTVGNRLKDVDGCIAITPVTATFQATRGYGNVERRMLPLILSWAVTVHKLQGTTLDRAVIDLGKKNFAKGQVYVALSRVKTLEGIALCDLEANKLLIRPHDERALAEMARLRELSSAMRNSQNQQ